MMILRIRVRVRAILRVRVKARVRVRVRVRFMVRVRVRVSFRVRGSVREAEMMILVSVLGLTDHVERIHKRGYNTIR